MKSRTTPCNVWRLVMTCFFFGYLHQSYYYGQARTKYGCITTRATGVEHPDAMSFPSHLEWLRGAFSPGSVMRASELVLGNSRTRMVVAGVGWGSVLFESAGLFHGEVINAGFRCHKTVKWVCCQLARGNIMRFGAYQREHARVSANRCVGPALLFACENLR
jgi:hypothetical protein